MLEAARQSANVIDLREVPFLAPFLWLSAPVCGALGIFLLTKTWRQCFGLWCLLAMLFLMLP